MSGVKGESPADDFLVLPGLLVLAPLLLGVRERPVKERQEDRLNRRLGKSGNDDLCPEARRWASALVHRACGPFQTHGFSGRSRTVTRISFVRWSMSCKHEGVSPIQVRMHRERTRRKRTWHMLV